MKRWTPYWLLAALPASILGHALSYALIGRTQSDGHHAYLGPLFAWSLTTLAGCCTVMLLRAVSGLPAGERRAVRIESLWARLALTQIVLYAAAERLEGYDPSLTAYFAEILVALLAAVAIVCFARFLSKCERAAYEASLYLRRLPGCAPLAFVIVEHSVYFARSVRLGLARFERPPPRTMSFNSIRDSVLRRISTCYEPSLQVSGQVVRSHSSL